jgi:lipid A disaccharide synthetase
MPGSVTAELAYLGVPTVVTVPLNLPEEVPLTGISEFIGRLPVVGAPIKRMAVRKALERIEFTAIPNKRQRRFITPEIRGVLTAEDVAIKVLELLQDSKARDRISVDLKEAMGRPGAAERVASSVLDTLITTGGRYFVPKERAH